MLLLRRRLVLAAALSSGVADARIRMWTGFSVVDIAPEDAPDRAEYGGVARGASVGQNVDGSCGLDDPCSGRDAGMCCSQHGYCGTTQAYCGSGCVSGAGDCWDDYDHNHGGWCSASIPCTGRFAGQCCSRYNHCGATEEYCGAGCIPGAGRCDYDDGDGHGEEGSGFDPWTAVEVA